MAEDARGPATAAAFDPVAGPPARGVLSKRDATVDALRGLAALLVLLQHLLRRDLFGERWFHSLDMGRMGVQLFFMISGFVVGALLIESPPEWRRIPGFMARRMARLGPPYAVTILASVALFAVYERIYPAGYFMPLRWDWLLCSLSYTCYPLQLPMYVDVGWSLEIEVQFYLLAALLMPLVGRYGARAGWALGALLLPGAFALSQHYALRYSAPFLLGMTALAYRRGALRAPLYWVVSLGLAAYWGAHLRQVETGAVLAFGATAIALRARLPRALVWLGGVSYSLYLVHKEVGSRLLSILRTLGAPMDGLWLWGWVGLAIATSLVVAVVMNRLVERPAIRWSHRFGEPSR